jgi:hypothetical protein
MNSYRRKLKVIELNNSAEFSDFWDELLSSITQNGLSITFFRRE